MLLSKGNQIGSVMFTRSTYSSFATFQNVQEKLLKDHGNAALKCILRYILFFIRKRPKLLYLSKTRVVSVCFQFYKHLLNLYDKSKVTFLSLNGLYPI